jgi:hypothetical protein
MYFEAIFLLHNEATIVRTWDSNEQLEQGLSREILEFRTASPIEPFVT